MTSIHKFRWPLSISFIMAFLFTLPFIVNNNYFIDDWLRSDTGNSGWEGNGRPFASILMSIVSLFPRGRIFFGDGSLFDVFPLTIIASSALLVVAGYVFCLAMKVDCKVKALVICALPVCNPFWVGNIEFRHDSLLMAASFLLAIYGSYISVRGLIHCLISSLLLAISLGLYQTSINAYIAMSACVILSGIISSDGNAIRKSLMSLASLLIGYLVYSKIIMAASGLSDYAIANSKMLDISNGFMSGIFKNIYAFIAFFIETSPPLYISSLSVLVLITIVSLFMQYGLTLKLLYSAIAIFICMMMTFGVLAIFERPAIAARTMMPLCLMPMLCISLCQGRLSIAANSIAAALILIAFSFSYIISSAINSVERNDRFIAMHIASLYAKESTNGSKSIYITGKPKFTRYADRVIKRLPMAKYMVISAFNNYKFKYSLLAQYGVNGKAPELKNAKRYDKISSTREPEFSDSLVSSFVDGNTIIYKIK